MNEMMTLAHYFYFNEKKKNHLKAYKHKKKNKKMFIWDGSH